jgi:hypothetical protein
MNAVTISTEHRAKIINEQLRPLLAGASGASGAGGAQQVSLVAWPVSFCSLTPGLVSGGVREDSLTNLLVLFPPFLPHVQAKLQRQASKLQALTGTTHEQRMQELIDRVVLDPSTEEGRARARFIKNLVVLEKEPGTMLGVMRQFMDSLQLYIEQKRGDDIKRQTPEVRHDTVSLRARCACSASSITLQRACAGQGRRCDDCHDW